MSSQLNIIINTKGTLTENNITFTPSMVFRKETRNTIYFPATVKITDSLIRKAVPSAGTGLQVFLSSSYFNDFIQYATNRRRYTPITLQEAEDTGIIEDNFKYFKDIFFLKNNRLFINGKAYNIINSKLDMTNSVLPKDKNNLNFTMSVDINIIESKNDSYVNRKRINCSERRNDIDEQWIKFFGYPLFDTRKAMAANLSQKAPVMFSSDDTGLTQKKSNVARYKRATRFVPSTAAIPTYAQPGLTNPYQPTINPYGFMPQQNNPFANDQANPSVGGRKSRRRKKYNRRTRKSGKSKH